MAAPVILFCFSNAVDDYLPALNREQRSLLRAMLSHDDRGTIQIRVVNATSIEDLFEYVNKYKNDLHVFHYAGHAHDRTLLLSREDGGNEAAHASGLAQLLGTCPQLKLVFLNGCATHSLTNELLKQPIPLVLATRAAIDDVMAVEFSEQFYYSFSAHTSIDVATNNAATFLKTKYKQFAHGQTMRGLVIPSSKQEELPWGLYENPTMDVGPSLSWQIPTLNRSVGPIPSGRRVNDVLIETMFHSVAGHSKELTRKINDKDVTIDEIKHELFDSFPLPIGEQLRKLLAKSLDEDDPDPMERYSQERLAQIIRAYRMSTRFIVSIMLAQLWDEKHKNKELTISEDYLAEFNAYLTLNEETARSFNYPNLIVAIADLLDDYDITYFIEELKEVRLGAKKDDILYEAIHGLNRINEDLRSDLGEEYNFKEKCLVAEKYLGQILKSFSFLVKYRLITIKNIEVIQPKYRERIFRHSQVSLSRALTLAALGTATDTIKDYKNHTDSRSVVFIKETNGQVSYLSLSPFIIDENALAGQRSTKLYCFNFWQGDKPVFEFIGSSIADLLRVDQESYPRVAEEFTQFKAEVFGMIGATEDDEADDLLSKLRQQP